MKVVKEMQCDDVVADGATGQPLQPLEPNAVVAVDVVLFTVRDAPTVEKSWQVLLTRTIDPAFAGRWALPGVLLRPEETFDAAARRALRDKAGLDAEDWYLDQIGTFGDPHRDSRGRVVSVAHVALERSDGLALVPGGTVTHAEWVPVRGLEPSSLAFDHAEILAVGERRIKSKLRYSWVAFQLLPGRFTLPELRRVYAAILDPSIARLNTSNFRKVFAPLFKSGVIVPVGAQAESGKVGRPGMIYRFEGPIEGTWERELPWHSES